MTPQDLLDRLQSDMSYLNITLPQFLYDDYSNSEYETLKKSVGDFEVVYNYRDARKNSDERQDEETVYYFKEHNVFIMFEHDYSSWDGMDVKQVYPVEPYEVKITKYRKIQ